MKAPVSDITGSLTFDMWYVHRKQRMKLVFEIGKEFSKITKTYYLVFIILKKKDFAV